MAANRICKTCGSKLIVRHERNRFVSIHADTGLNYCQAKSYSPAGHTTSSRGYDPDQAAEQRHFSTESRATLYL